MYTVTRQSVRRLRMETRIQETLISRFQSTILIAFSHTLTVSVEHLYFQAFKDLFLALCSSVNCVLAALKFNKQLDFCESSDLVCVNFASVLLAVLVDFRYNLVVDSLVRCYRCVHIRHPVTSDVVVRLDGHIFYCVIRCLTIKLRSLDFGILEDLCDCLTARLPSLKV